MSVHATTKKSSHISNVDMVRAVALVAIVIGHVYTQSEIADRLIQSWRLPIFFMLSGYFWSSRRDFSQEVSGRWNRLLVPYLWWLAILALISLPVRAIRDPEALVPAITGVLFGGSYAERPFTTFWFFTALFVATVIFRYLTSFPSWVRLSAVALGLLSNILFGPELAIVPYSTATALGAIVFLEAGRVVRRAQANFSRRYLAWVAFGSLTMAGTALIAVKDFVPIDMKSGKFPPLAIAVAVLIGVALLLAATSLPSLGARTGRLFEVLATPSMAIIILHPLVLWALRPESGHLPLWVIAVAAYILPLAGGLLLARTKLAPYLLGVAPKRSDPGWVSVSSPASMR